MLRNFQLTNRQSPITILLLILVSLAIPVTAFAQDADPTAPTDDEVNAIAKEMYCPVCENVPLDVCGTQACADWREEIRMKLAEGWSEDQIKQYFADRFGDRVLAEPPRQGFNWLVYVVPPIAFLAGVIILIRGVQSWRRIEPVSVGDEPSPQAEEIPADDYVERFEEELRRREQ